VYFPVSISQVTGCEDCLLDYVGWSIKLQSNSKCAIVGCDYTEPAAIRSVLWSADNKRPTIQAVNITVMASSVPHDSQCVQWNMQWVCSVSTLWYS